MLHKNLTMEKWVSYGKSKQIMMIANELNRARRACENKQEDIKIAALLRAVELIDFAVGAADRPSFRRELLRFGEVVRGLTIESVVFSINTALKVVLTFDRISFLQISAMGL